MKKLIFVLCVSKRIHVDTQRTHENETTPKTEPQKCVLISEAYIQGQYQPASIIADSTKDH